MPPLGANDGSVALGAVWGSGSIVAGRLPVAFTFSTASNFLQHFRSTHILVGLVVELRPKSPFGQKLIKLLEVIGGTVRLPKAYLCHRAP